MICVDFLINEEGFITGFEIRGHSGFAESGKDIVCSAVSSASLMTANTISDVIYADADIRVFEEGELHLDIRDKSLRECQDILKGMKLHMKNLEEQYPNNIVVNLREV